MRTTDHLRADQLIGAWVAEGLTDVVLSPGSRNAPLVLAVRSHPHLHVYTALDERSAAHIALGLALVSRRPTVVISTSGTAAINHGPAIAEAYYQGVPLISVTADRSELDRKSGAGQSVNQRDLFSMHTVWSTELSAHMQEANAAVDCARKAWSEALKGPVHVNLPLQEPLYGMVEKPREVAGNLWPAHNGDGRESPVQIPEDLMAFLSAYDARVLLHVGAGSALDLTESLVSDLSERFGLILDAFGCRQSLAEQSTMRWLCGWNQEEDQAMKPDVILTIGLPPMDKKFRALLTDWKAAHWHIGTEHHTWDMFGSFAGAWRIAPQHALQELVHSMPGFNGYAQRWQLRKDRLERAEAELIRSREERSWVDFEVYAWLAEALPLNSQLHFANSTSARYAQWFDWKNRRLHANRGVAGIDGCLSTAVGDAFSQPDVPTVLITGDAAWLYDVNGLHVSPRPHNLKIIVLNNGGGNIFRWLDGPESSGWLEEHFEAGFAQSMEGSARQLGLAYAVARNWETLQKAFDGWVNNSGPCLLEIQTPGQASAAYLKARLHSIAVHPLNRTP